MFKKIKSLLPFFSPEQKKSSVIETYGLDKLDNESIGSLSLPQGIPVTQPNVIIERMNPEIRFLKNEMGLRNDDFNDFILPILLRFIEYADLLPASKYHHHSTGGGLIAHSFDVAKRAMRAAQHTQFPIGLGTLADTQQSNDQWRAGTVLAALLHDGGKILADMVVCNGAQDDKRIIWDAHGDRSIYQWAKANNIERYFISWNKERHMKHQNASLMVMQRIVPQKTWSWIDSCFDGKNVYSAMLAAIAKGGLEHPTSKIVAECDSESVKTDMFTKNSNITKEVTKVPLSELLTMLMKHFILTKHWNINKKNAPVWFVNDKLYVVWTTAIPDLIESMINTGYSIPESADVLAQIMIEEGAALRGADSVYTEIYPEILGDKNKAFGLRALAIRNIEQLIFEPEKLYSIKEHDKRPKAVSIENTQDNEPDENTSTISDKDSAIVEDLFEGVHGEWEDEHHSNGAYTQKMYETSGETFVRILENMVTIKRAANQKKAAVLSEQKEAVVTDDSNETIENQALVNSDNESGTDLSEIEDAVNQIHDPEADELKTPMAIALQAHFGFDVMKGKVIIPLTDKQEALDFVIDNPDFDVDFHNANKVVNEEVEIEFL